MIRQTAFIEKNKMLKGGLHCHTTRSDGHCTPEETMKLHKENGYDFLAITDHRIYNYTNFAPETGITLIPGMEVDNAGIPCKSGFRCYHSVCIGPAQEDGNGYAQDEIVPTVQAPDQESFQRFLDEIHAKKNLTIYCHPEWSSTPARFFEKLKGNFAMEIWNSGCVIDNDMDKDAAYWDELLGQGSRIFGVATDDGHPIYHQCKGWVMVNAENNVNAILKALENGAFYSSTGPEIYDFYIKDGKAVVECSPSATIRVHCDCHPTRLHRAEVGQALTRAEFDVSDYPYVRISIIDEQGRFAWTNPIFLD